MVSFVKWKFNRMLAVATVVMAVNYVVMLSGSVIVGNLVGPEGLAGLNVCTPAFGVASFFAALLSVGTALVFSRAMGAFDERRAAGVFSQSMMLAAGMGALIWCTMHFGEGLYLDLTGVTGAVRLQAEHYWRWQAVSMALLPSVLTLEALVYADGDGAVALLAGGVHVAGAIGLAAFCTWRDGNAGGASLGTAVTMTAVLAVCGVHFCRANNHLKFRRYFSSQGLRETIAASLADSTIYLCWGLLILIVNRFALDLFGQALLPVVALAASVVEFSIVFDGVGEALIPLGGMYDGEGNWPALRELAGHSAFVATVEGAVCGAAFFVLAPLVAAAYGIRGEAAGLLPQAVTMIRTLALAMPFMGFLMMANTHYLVVHHVPFAVSVTVVKDFVCPCVGVLALGAAWGEPGLWAGFAAGYAVAAAYPFAFVRLRHGRESFPWLIERDDGKSIDFAILVSERTLADAGARIGEFLNGHGVYEAVVGRISCLVMEAGRLTAKGLRRPVRAEYFVSLETPGEIRLVVRDNGPCDDVNVRVKTEIGASGLRYLNTLGCNRSEYRFDIPRIK